MKPEGDPTESTAPAKGDTRLYVRVSVLCLIMMLLPAAVIGYVSRPEWEPCFWPAVPCQIVATSAAITDSGDAPYAFVVRYRYKVLPEADGQVFESRQVAREYRGATDYADVQRLLLRFPPGASATCYVDPQEPGEAVLLNPVPWQWAEITLLLLVLVVGAVGWPLVANHRLKRAASPANSSLSALARWRLAAQAESRRMISWMGIVGCGVVGLMGLGVLCGDDLPRIRQLLAVRTWPQVPCRIIHSRLLQRGGEEVYYQIDILYEYRAGHQVLRANAYHPLGELSTDLRAQRTVLAGYPAGAERTCRVNPRDPTQAALAWGLNWGLLLPACALFLALIGVTGVWVFWRQLHGKGPLRAPGSKAELAGRAVTGWLLAPPSTGPPALRPKVSPLVRFIWFAVFAAMYNSMIGFLIWVTLDAGGPGEWEWSSAVCFGVLAAVGLVMLVMTLYFLLPAFNARPQLCLETGPVRLGRTVLVRWRLRGRTSRIRRLTIAVVAREEATDRRDKKTREVFLERPLVDVTNPQMMHEGRFELTLPVGTMHSFATLTNKIVWFFRIHGEIPYWPHLMEEIEFTVLPQEPRLPLQSQPSCPPPAQPGT